MRSIFAGSRGEWARRGVVALEFALVLPILLALTLGLIDYGWYFYVQLSAQNAAREGARTATTVPGPCPNTAALTVGTAAAQSYLDGLGVGRYASISGDCNTLSDPVSPLFELRVVVTFPRPTGFLLVPMPSAGGGAPADHVVARARATMRGVQ